MALGKNIIITADTQQAISEINKLDVSQSNLIANSFKMSQSLTGVGAALGGITALAGGVIAMAASFHEATVATGQLYDMMGTEGGGNLQKLTKDTGGLIASQALLAAQARLTGQGLGDFTAVLGKAATVMADKFGQGEEEVLGKLVKMVVTGKKVERGMAQLGIELLEPIDFIGLVNDFCRRGRGAEPQGAPGLAQGQDQGVVFSIRPGGGGIKLCITGVEFQDAPVF